jgi:hypothetical protein
VDRIRIFRWAVNHMAPPRMIVRRSLRLLYLIFLQLLSLLLLLGRSSASKDVDAEHYKISES